MENENQPVLVGTDQVFGPPLHLSRARAAMAFAVAAVSDFLSIWLDIALPIQWLLDLSTAGALFLILGRRWALLPGLVAEAIPGVGVFPVWVLVVLSIVLHDEIKVRRNGYRLLPDEKKAAEPTSAHGIPRFFSSRPK
ncbi:MAG TPA: hypothetical protein VJW77_06375 [Terriglobia bacterium]|nr:hypothetical protein [Terriglobia bacterium]